MNYEVGTADLEKRKKQTYVTTKTPSHLLRWKRWLQFANTENSSELPKLTKDALKLNACFSQKYFNEILHRKHLPHHS